MGPMRKSRLSRYKQDRLIEHFVAGTTARTASSLCGVNRKTAAFYFLRLREIIGLELEAESEAMFGARLRWMKVTLVANERVSGDGEPLETPRDLAYCNAEGGSTQR